MDKETLISHYQLQSHPEGGYYARTYKSQLEVKTPYGLRPSSTAIHFLISNVSISHFHRLKSDEGWHFHLGSPLTIIEITLGGEIIETKLGTNIKDEHKLQHFVPAGHWFASSSEGDFSFVTCTVSPGFDFSDFEMAKKTELLRKFPQHQKYIEKYCLD